MGGDDILIPRDWKAVTEQVKATAPFNYAVLDDFLTDAACSRLRADVLSNWGWHYKSHWANELYLSSPKLPLAIDIAEHLRAKLPDLLEGMELVQWWAFLHQRNSGLRVHSDNGSITVNIWLTPDQFNENPESGGMVLHDVKRTESMMIHEFASDPWASEYFSATTQGACHQVAYRYNRAVIFDSRTFHASESLAFSSEAVETRRINFSLLFDNRVDFDRRCAPFTK